MCEKWSAQKSVKKKETAKKRERGMRVLRKNKQDSTKGVRNGVWRWWCHRAVVKPGLDLQSLLTKK